MPRLGTSSQPLSPHTQHADPDVAFSELTLCESFADVCSENMPKRPFLTSPPRSHHQIIEKWCQERSGPSQQIVGVLRHTERADSSWALVDNSSWHHTNDFKLWPLDPPLSDNGVKVAKQLGNQVHTWVGSVGAEIHVVVCSPYLRCVQTAIEVCCALGPGTRLLIDRSLGEVYGPCVMLGLESVEAEIVRPIDNTFALCRERGVDCQWESVGCWPTWPEDLRTARRRFATRYLTYVRRGVRVRRNFLIVSHADCVGAALSMMPSEADSIVEQVDYGGMFLAHRDLQAIPFVSKRRVSAPGLLEQNPFSSERSVEESEYTSEARDLYSSEASDIEENINRGNDSCNLRKQGSACSHNSEDSPLNPSRSSSKSIIESVACTSSDSWKVKSLGISRMSSGDKKKSVLQRRLNDLVKDGCFSRRMIEKLLCQSLSDSPLGVEDTINHEEPGFDVEELGWRHLEFKSLHLSRTSSFTNSTLLFGMSSTNLEKLAQIPSRSATLNSDAFRHTLSNIDAEHQDDLTECCSHSMQGSKTSSARCLIRSATNTLSYDPIADECAGKDLVKNPKDKSEAKTVHLMDSSNSRLAKRRLSEKLVAPIGMPPIHHAAQAKLMEATQ